MLGSLANALLFPIFGAGLMLACKDLDQGGSIEIAHLFLGFKRRTSDLVLVGVFNLVGWVLIALAVIRGSRRRRVPGHAARRRRPARAYPCYRC